MKDIYNGLLAKKLIAEFERRGFEGYYCETGEKALEKALSFVQKDSDVISSGGSETLREIGFHDAMKGGGYRFLNPRDAKNTGEMQNIAREALSADYYFMSANAITEAGELVHIDGIGNRTAALMFGPKRVVIVAGMNKVAPDLDCAVQRAKTYASRLSVLMFNKDFDSFEALCAAAENSGSSLVVTNKSVMKGRVKIILVGEELGA